MKFYTSIFKKSKIGRIARYGEEGYEIHETGGHRHDDRI